MQNMIGTGSLVVERERVQRYVASLEQVIRNTHLGLTETITQFQELSQRVSTERGVPPGIIADFRKTYKEIQDQLTKIRGVNQVLEGRYRRYYRRDSLRDREITEFAFLAKNLYQRFELILHGIEEKRKAKEREEGSERCGQHTAFSWFHSKENQGVLLRNLNSLNELDYKNQSRPGVEDKRRVIQDRLRSLSLFAFSGEVSLIDVLQPRMQLREYDIKERYAGEELRGVLTHLREISSPEVERVMRRYMDSSEFSGLKCLLFSIQSQKDLEKEVLGLTDRILQGMTEGEVKTLSI